MTSKSDYVLPIPKTSFWAGLFLLIGVFAGFYISVKIDIEKLKAKQDYQDTTQQAERKNYEKVNEKLDFIITKIADLDATMKFKEDKKSISTNSSYNGGSSSSSGFSSK